MPTVLVVADDHPYAKQIQQKMASLERTLDAYRKAGKPKAFVEQTRKSELDKYATSIEAGLKQLDLQSAERAASQAQFEARNAEIAAQAQQRKATADAVNAAKQAEYA